MYKYYNLIKLRFFIYILTQVRGSSQLDNIIARLNFLWIAAFSIVTSCKNILSKLVDYDIFF